MGFNLDPLDRPSSPAPLREDRPCDPLGEVCAKRNEGTETGVRLKGICTERPDIDRGEHAKPGELSSHFEVFHPVWTKTGIPSSKRLFQFSVEHLDARLQEQVGSLRAPLHLLPL